MSSLVGIGRGCDLELPSGRLAAPCKRPFLKSAPSARSPEPIRKGKSPLVRPQRLFAFAKSGRPLGSSPLSSHRCTNQARRYEWSRTRRHRPRDRPGPSRQLAPCRDQRSLLSPPPQLVSAPHRAFPNAQLVIVPHAASPESSTAQSQRVGLVHPARAHERPEPVALTAARAAKRGSAGGAGGRSKTPGRGKPRQADALKSTPEAGRCRRTPHCICAEFCGQCLPSPEGRPSTQNRR